MREAPAVKLVQTTSIQPTDFVIEIGPGRGALTKPLSNRTGRLLAVEVDGYLASKLHTRLGDGVRVVAQDFLQFQLPAEPYKVVSNTPFSKSTDIIRKLTSGPNPPEDAWLVVQRELGWRFCGPPYGSESLWSLRLKPHWHLEIVDWLKPADFDPPPKVDSVLLWMSRRDRRLLSTRESRIYENLVSAAFAQRGPVRTTLRPWLSKLQLRRLAQDLRFRVDADATSLIFKQWLGIVRFVARQESDPRS